MAANATLRQRQGQAEALTAVPREPHKARVRATSRASALDLAARLNGHRWYMLMPNQEHWEVVIELNDPDGQLLPDLHDLIREWVRDNSLPMTEITIGGKRIDVFAPDPV